MSKNCCRFCDGAKKDLCRLIHLQNESSFFAPLSSTSSFPTPPVLLWHCGASVSMSFILVWPFFLPNSTHFVHISVLFRFLLLQLLEWYISLRSCCYCCCYHQWTVFHISDSSEYTSSNTKGNEKRIRQEIQATETDRYAINGVRRRRGRRRKKACKKQTNKKEE